ncbi:MAG: CDP-glycerol glycerophosphotransferase family protein [Candidatus Cloacimonadales bacterium]
MKILFYVSKAYSIPIVEPLLRECNRQSIEFALLVSQKVRRNLPDYWEELEIFTYLAEAQAYAADFVLCPGNFVDWRLPGIKVEIFHGLGVEKASHYKIRHFFDLYLTSGPYVTERFQKLANQHKYFLVRETGWPKVDHIINYPSQNIREKLKLPNDKNIVLFAPTHSSKMQSASALLPIIPEVIGPDELWLVKFHELMKPELKANFSAQHPAIKIIENADITPYLHAADLLISDTSSVIYEFMILDKPIITFRTEARPEKGIDIKQPTELAKAIQRCWENPREYAEQRQQHLQEINPYLDGKISQNILATLHDVETNNLLPQHPKPLNLFRKAQILYHQKFKQGYMR